MEGNNLQNYTSDKIIKELSNFLSENDTDTETKVSIIIIIILFFFLPNSCQMF